MSSPLNIEDEAAESFVLKTKIGNFTITFTGENHVYFHGAPLCINGVLCRGSYHLYGKEDGSWVCFEELGNPRNNSLYWKMQSAYLSRTDKYAELSAAAKTKFFQSIEDSFKEWRENNSETLKKELSRAYVQHWTEEKERKLAEISELEAKLEEAAEELAEIERKLD